MAKRFTETLKWDDRWFRSLRPEYKLAWIYLLDKCDAAGVLEIDEDLANFQIGVTVDWADFCEACDGRITSLAGGKWWVAKFCEFQYGKISESCRAHNPVFTLLRKHGILELQLGEKKKPKKPKETTEEASARNHPDEFESFWAAYPRVRRVNKAEALKAWQKAVKLVSAEVLIESAKEYGESPLGSGEFSCMPATFLNRKKWEDDRAAWQRSDQKKTFAQIREENTDAAGERFEERWKDSLGILEGLQ